MPTEFTPVALCRASDAVRLTLTRIATADDTKAADAHDSAGDDDEEEHSAELRFRIGDLLCAPLAPIAVPQSMVLCTHFTAHVMMLAGGVAEELKLSLRSNMPVIVAPLRAFPLSERIEVHGRIERVLTQLTPTATAAPGPGGDAGEVPGSIVAKKKPERITPGQFCSLEIRVALPLPLLAAGSSPYPQRALHSFVLRLPPSAQAHVIQSTEPVAYGIVTELH